ncbi:Cation/H+ exchanger [Dipodascopsis tothii]|uniref:Cation/H+ exchanger n=1 Tax=Dipodascopsis tothii TaxID=44089 RepID=UPI0034CFDD39
MPTLALSNFNVVCALFGSVVLLYGLVSKFLADSLYLSEVLPSLLLGVAFKAAGWLRPEEYAEGSVDVVMREFSRLVLGIQLALVGAQLPAQYAWKHKLSISILLGPVMSIMWLASAGIILACIPGLRFLDALLIAACVTPTDPVLCNSIVKGSYAEKNVPEELRNLITAESGANDGFGYPFLFLAVYILRDHGTQIARDWIVETLLYEIALSIAYGIVAAYVCRKGVALFRKKNLMDHDLYLFSIVAMALFVMGTCGLIGTDDLLACFIAGNAFNWDDSFRLDSAGDSMQGTLDVLLNIAFFMWFGASNRWHEYVDSAFSVWRYIAMGVAIMVLRRLPAVALFYRTLPSVTSIRDMVFLGYFGPIGVGAIFYLEVSIETLAGLEQTPQLVYVLEVIRPVVTFLVLSSIVTHGLTIGLAELGLVAAQGVRRRPATLPLATTLTLVTAPSVHLGTHKVPAEAEAGSSSIFV